MNLATLLARAARVDPAAPALHVGRRLHSRYGEFDRRARALATSMLDAGLARGDRVALFMTNTPEFLEVVFGAWYAGLAVVPVNCKLHPREAAYIVDHGEARAVFVTPDVGHALMPLVPGLRRVEHVIDVRTPAFASMTESRAADIADRAPDDLAWLFYTSGTTGQPKGVMITHRNLLAMTLCYFSDVDAATREDAILYAAPMSHGAGMYAFAHVLAGARHVVPESGGFDPAEIVELSAHHRNVAMFAAPTMVKRLVDHVEATGADPSGVKTIVYGGGPMYAADIRRAMAVMGPRFVQIYGQGESPMTITALARRHLLDTSHPRHTERLASVGVAQSCVEVRVTDENGRSLPNGTPGEVVVRGDTVMKGYWRNAEATANTIRDGWLFTGDVGALDDDGFLTLMDRSKDMIISGGSNIYPREVEEVLLGHPAVAEVSVVGKPHADWGEEVVAFVVLREGARATGAELDRLCLDHIARFKRPKQYLFVAALPKNNYGKVLKTELRNRLVPPADPPA
ncbi:MAG: AMP-binding protein [Betaproteobacteria bacterium]|nr:AMP-binding protein [Betaproteobacteria bacterium]